VRVNNRIIDMKEVKRIVEIITINHMKDIKIAIRKNQEKKVTKTGEKMRRRKNKKEAQAEAEAEVIAEVGVEVEARATVRTMMTRKKLG